QPLSPAPTLSSKASSASLPGSAPPAHATLDKSARGEKLTANQRRRRNRANQLASSSASVTSTISSSTLSSPEVPLSIITPQARAPRPIPLAATTPSPSSSVTPPTSATTGKPPLPRSALKSLPPQHHIVHPSPTSALPTPANLATSQKRQHSPPTSPHWNARSTDTLFRKNLPARQGHDWRAAVGQGSSGSDTSNGLGAPYEYASLEELRTQPTPPPFSFDHIIQSRSRAIVFCPPPQTSSTASTGSARSFQTTTTVRNTGTSSYVSSPASPSPNFANTVFGTSGASLPTTRTPQTAQQAQVPSTPLRTGGNQLEIGQQSTDVRPQLCAFSGYECGTSTSVGTRPTRSLPIVGTPSTPSYPTTFESIPNTVQANTLMDLEH
ncbi:hypothetical protein P7C70_g9504, partial [Phenoliferia sp. Uapishka_3]